MSWRQATFVFISTNTTHDEGGVEERWLPVMGELVRLGATVNFLCFSDSQLAAPARALGVEVSQYILDKWNVVRSRSRLRKYLRRYEPVCAHSTGVEADLLLRWAARKVPQVRIATTLAVGASRTRRRGPVNALMQRLDDAGLSREDAVFVDSDELAEAARASGVPEERIVPDVPDGEPGSVAERVRRHIGVYNSFVKERGIQQ